MPGRSPGRRGREGGAGDRRRAFVVAIDGPAGSGKSTTARLAAGRLGLRHLDTGAMYRAVALACLDAGADPADAGTMRRLLARARVDIDWRAGVQRVFLDGRDVSRAIREPRVSGVVSEVSAVPAVRRAMVAVQRRVARGREVVCEGRDIGSVVFPGAQVKVFLDCDLRARTARRRAELAAAGVSTGQAAVRANLARRDRLDSGRAMSPLVRTPDAVLVDTTDLTIEEQVAVVCELVRRVRPLP
ncbi:MAG: (d)CMP kinase [bacterium]